MPKLSRLKQWGKANFWFSLVLLGLGIMAAFSLAYGFMRTNDNPAASDTANNLTNTGSFYLPELALLPDDGTTGQDAGAALGASDGQLPCQASERARVLVPVIQAANDEAKLHQQNLKQIDNEKLLTKLLDNSVVQKEMNRHESVLSQLATQEAHALASIGC